MNIVATVTFIIVEPDLLGSWAFLFFHFHTAVQRKCILTSFAADACSTVAAMNSFPFKLGEKSSV